MYIIPDYYTLMINIFKSPKKQETQTQTMSNVNNLLVQQFNNLNIEIHGTYEEPLFKANDIGKLLEIRNIHSSISGLSEKDKVIRTTDTLGGRQEMLFFTETGVYKMHRKAQK